MRAGDDLFRTVRSLEKGDQTRLGRTVGDLAGSHRKPALNCGRASRVLRQPVRAAHLFGEINENGVGIRDDRSAIVKHRQLTEGIELQKRLLLVFFAGEIDEHEFVLDPQKREEQPDAVRMAGKWVMIELHLVLLNE